MKPKTPKKITHTIQPMLTEVDLQSIGNLVGGLMDKQAAVLASKTDLEEVKNRLEAIEGTLVTKQDLVVLRSELKDYINQGVETLMSGMDSLSEQMAEKKTVEELGDWAVQAGNKIGIKVKQKNL